MRGVDLSRPNEPAVNAHGKIIAIDHHIAQQTPFVQQINEQGRADHPRRKHQDLVLLGIPNREEAKDHGNDLNNDVQGLIVLILPEQIINNLGHGPFCRH